MGLSKKLAQPSFSYETDVVVGTLDYGRVRVASATMGFKHRQLDPGPVLAGIAQPNFLLKIIPHVDGTPRICELVRYHMVDVNCTAPGRRPHRWSCTRTRWRRWPTCRCSRWNPPCITSPT